ncbi:hypothetical protein HMSSN036_49800 [Paenibacillus macerans]|uniref:Uncharacterized protein n=1 Tax=Paenibacillus macerans TaxID=44252 RepID=A0A6N8EUF9_PAEMA|nr:hypothetical protein [Paenibacillus macerans]MBS5911141.1 hypothetical protein [Paenibacillus macerans]MCY7562352.1 hypothetical protein [Paenibacillus macerans]MDU5945529.1 hypothetical protein [Paenibacillus macerans]MDU7474733.1 hypothetical protein [Paenibacillus macerans]MEC0148997.1 hypothetical protein [Paenibacillus macerans]
MIVLPITADGLTNTTEWIVDFSKRESFLGMLQGITETWDRLEEHLSEVK